MAYVKVPVDVTQVKNKVLFHLTLRQLVCFSIGGVVGITWYLLTKEWMGTTMAASVMILIMLPFFLLAIYERDGRYLEQFIKIAVTWRWKTSRIRMYRTRNIWATAEEMLKEEKVMKTDEDQRRDRTKKKSQSYAGKRTIRKRKKKSGPQNQKEKKAAGMEKKRTGNHTI